MIFRVKVEWSGSSLTFWRMKFAEKLLGPDNKVPDVFEKSKRPLHYLNVDKMKRNILNELLNY